MRDLPTARMLLLTRCFVLRALLLVSLIVFQSWEGVRRAAGDGQEPGTGFAPSPSPGAAAVPGVLLQRVLINYPGAGAGD